MSAWQDLLRRIMQFPPRRELVACRRSSNLRRKDRPGLTTLQAWDSRPMRDSSSFLWQDFPHEAVTSDGIASLPVGAAPPRRCRSRYPERRDMSWGLPICEGPWARPTEHTPCPLSALPADTPRSVGVPQ